MDISKAISTKEFKNKVVNLIVQLAGGNPDKLHQQDIHDLLQQLAHLMQVEKQKLSELLVEHDQNQELDEVALAAMWKLVSKGVIKGKRKPFGSLQEEVFNNLKFIMGMLGDLARFRADNNLGPASSVMNNPVYERKQVNSTIINPETFRKWENILALQGGRAANANAIDPSKF